MVFQNKILSFRIFSKDLQASIIIMLGPQFVIIMLFIVIRWLGPRKSNAFPECILRLHFLYRTFITSVIQGGFGSQPTTEMLSSICKGHLQC